MALNLVYSIVCLLIDLLLALGPARGPDEDGPVVVDEPLP